MKPILVVGSINMDLVSQAERIPKAGETITGTGFQMYSGGKGANQAVAVARLGYPSILLGVLGSDIFGSQLLSTLNDFGVDTNHIGKTAGSSGTASIVVDEHGENTIIVTPGANTDVTPEFLLSKMDVLRSAGMVLTQLEIPMDTIAWLADQCHELGIPLMLDPAPAAAIPPALLSRVTWFTPNQTEAIFYGGAGESDEKMLARFFGMGIQNVVLKQGGDGALVASAGGARDHVDACRVIAVDTTAAGDAFNGAFAVGLMRGQTVVESARFASAVAAVSVTKHGAQSSLPSQDDVLEMYGSSISVAQPLK